MHETELVSNRVLSVTVKMHAASCKVRLVKEPPTVSRHVQAKAGRITKGKRATGL